MRVEADYQAYTCKEKAKTQLQEFSRVGKQIRYRDAAAAGHHGFSARRSSCEN